MCTTTIFCARTHLFVCAVIYTTFNWRPELAHTKQMTESLRNYSPRDTLKDDVGTSLDHIYNIKSFRSSVLTTLNILCHLNCIDTKYEWSITVKNTINFFVYFYAPVLRLVSCKRSITLKV